MDQVKFVEYNLEKFEVTLTHLVSKVYLKKRVCWIRKKKKKKNFKRKKKEKKGKQEHNQKQWSLSPDYQQKMRMMIFIQS